MNNNAVQNHCMLQFLHMKKSNPLIVGNWKLNPVAQSDAVDLATGVVKKVKKIDSAYFAIAPSYPHLAPVQQKIKKSEISLAAQDVSTASVGAFTGEVSILQLKDMGVEFVILGHSERRAMGEKDQSINQKTHLVLKHRMTPIVCVGEKKRDKKGDYLAFIETQITQLATELTAAQIKKVVIAYEPIWAIGTGETATVEDVKETQIFIESVLTKLYDRKTAKAVRLLYGGSVKPHNAAELQAGGGMNGFLVGGASLKAADFADIITQSIS
jgi:triosephosphate isomerase